jgi:hypothetical protein
MEEKKVYAVFGGEGDDRRGSEYHREFGGGNEIHLKKGIARPVSDEVAGILKHVRGVIVFDGVDESPIDFKKRMIREDWKELVKKYGIKKAATIREEYNERSRQAGD